MFSSPEEVFEKEKRYMMQTYKRPRIVLKDGKGATVKDSVGREYIDCGKSNGCGFSNRCNACKGRDRI